MRGLVIFFLFCCSKAYAQQQETNLVDRLLRPKMELRNNAQTKKFSGSDSARMDRRGNVQTFYLQPNRAEKRVAETHNYSATQFATRQFTSERRPPAVTQPPIAGTNFATTSVRDTRAAYDAHNGITARDYSDQRAFKDEGKSQKSLDRQNPPMTIDQVRELLNKNK